MKRFSTSIIQYALILQRFVFIYKVSFRQMDIEALLIASYNRLVVK